MTTWKPSGIPGDTDRRPRQGRTPAAGVDPYRFEWWIDRQIREATERGEFDDLPGHGQPIPDIDKAYDEMWWVKAKLKREGVALTPPTLALRREAEDAHDAALAARTDAEARRILEAVNEKIRAAIRVPPAGPPLNLMPFDIDRVLRRRRGEL